MLSAIEIKKRDNLILICDDFGILFAYLIAHSIKKDTILNSSQFTNCNQMLLTTL